MDISLILKIAGIGILVAICALFLQKSGKDEQAMMLTASSLPVRSQAWDSEHCSPLSPWQAMLGWQGPAHGLT